MNHERNILASVLKSADAFQKIHGRLSDEDLSEQGRIVYEAIEKFYGKDTEANRADSTLILNSIHRRLTNPKHHDSFTKFLSEIEAAEVSPANVLSDFFAMKRQDTGHRLAAALLGARENEIPELMEEYERWKEPEEDDQDSAHEIVSGMLASDLVRTRLSSDNYIKVLPRALNDKLDGGLLPGNHVVVFARPEIGKTLFVINLLAGFARQNLRTLYVGNEDPLPDIIMRTICRLSGRTKEEVVADPDAADERARETGYGNVVFASLTPGTPKEIEELIKEYDIQVVVVDQLRNLSMKEDNTVVMLEKAARAMRTVCKRHGVVGISVTQAGDSASGKAVLEYNDIDFSNTGIPASADVIIGIGATRDDEMSDRRVISLPKNKRGGMHGYFPVMVDRYRSKVISLENK